MFGSGTIEDMRVVKKPASLTASSVTAGTRLANKKPALERLRNAILNRNKTAKKALLKAKWNTRNEPERDNAVAVFSGLDFRLVKGGPIVSGDTQNTVNGLN
jgi:hypothetical protein